MPITEKENYLGELHCRSLRKRAAFGGIFVGVNFCKGVRAKF